MAGNTRKTKERIGIALGSGAARGWSHIGVLRGLAELGIHPDVISGCSIGAIVGAAYAAGNLDKLEEKVLSFNRLDMVRYFDFNLSLNGFVHRERLQQFFHDFVCSSSTTIQELELKFATVATYLNSGREMWFTEGKVLDAIMASITLPGLFPPFQYEDKWLVDGGLVNPVPVSLCRALGADTIIAVNLNGAITKRHFAPQPLTTLNPELAERTEANTSNKFLSNVTSLLTGNRAAGMPNLIEALAGSINIMQDKITRSRMVGDPPEILLVPKVIDISLLEFYRAQEAIQAGRDSVQRIKHEIEDTLLNH